LSKKRAGFTLIELLIVSMVILALVSFSTPFFRKSFTDLELKEAVSSISKLMGLAQQRAIIERRGYRLLFDFGNKSYRLYRVEGEGQNIKFINVADNFGRLFKIPGNIDIKGNAKEIIFYPDGSCTAPGAADLEVIELEFINRNERVMKISVIEATGNAVITEKK
jgi:prepilin-type N-terminal cleavage/methylation domain-containing protein